jgi:hypothetical protein
VCETRTIPPTASPAPILIEQLQSGVPAALAMLAGMKLDLFGQLVGGPREATEIAEALGVEPSRLSSLLFALAASACSNATRPDSPILPRRRPTSSVDARSIRRRSDRGPRGGRDRADVQNAAGVHGRRRAHSVCLGENLG